MPKPPAGYAKNKTPSFQNLFCNTMFLYYINIMSKSDDGLDALINIKSDFLSFCNEHGSVSEADTRVKIIDRILKEVCEWPESAITREEHVATGFVDYVLTINNRRFVAVEAKKEGISFTIPYDKDHSHYKISGSLATDKEVRSALDQVRTYCDDSAIRYAIATNGYAWIIFRAIREDLPWKEGRAKVFPSLDYITEHFSDFWNLLSYPAVSAGALDEEFGVLQPVSRTLYRVVDRLFNADLPLQRNRLNAQLEPLTRAIFDNIADQDFLEILESCYVHSSSLRIVAKDLDFVIEDSIPRFLSNQGTEELSQGETHSGSFGSAMSRAMIHKNGELFLLLGGIGSGKTTFLRRYQRTVGKDLLERRAVWFHIDFLKAPLDPMDLEEFVWREILDQLRDRYTATTIENRRNIKRVFLKDINALKETTLKYLHEGQPEYEHILSKHLEQWQQDLSRYVPGLLNVCKEREDLAVVLFIDNVDQLSPAYQAQIFLLAQRVARTARCITVVSLREESYYATSVKKTFTAYSNRKFHIASPLFRVLIGNRIQYAIKLLQKSDEELQVILSSGIKIEKNSIIELLKIVQESIFLKNKNIAMFIEAICFGNMRLALQMFTTFLTSGATDVDKMLFKYRQTGAYYVAYHEFVKSIILGDRKYYKEGQSPIMNVFDCGTERNASHFTSLRILEMLLLHRREYSQEGQGYVELSNLMTSFDDLFDNRADFIRTINRLVARQLVEVNTRSPENIYGASHVRITSSGWYYIYYLSSTFPYLDLVLQDTPLEDENLENELRQAVFQVDNLSDREEQKIERMNVRFTRVEKFINYLEKQEDDERIKFGLDKYNNPISKHFVPHIKESYAYQRDWILRRIKENREKLAEDIQIGDEDTDIQLITTIGKDIDTDKSDIGS